MHWECSSFPVEKREAVTRRKRAGVGGHDAAQLKITMTVAGLTQPSNHRSQEAGIHPGSTVRPLNGVNSYHVKYLPSVNLGQVSELLSKLFLKTNSRNSRPNLRLGKQ